MGLVRIYIVDDEWIAVVYFIALLYVASPAYVVAGAAFQGRIAYVEIFFIRPDIVFVDILMPGMTGIVLAELLSFSESYPIVIFLTSYRDFDFVFIGMDLCIASYLFFNVLTTVLFFIVIDFIMLDTEIESYFTYMYTSYHL